MHSRSRGEYKVRPNTQSKKSKIAKEHADELASAFKRRHGDSRGVGRPSPSVALLLIGVEDSVDEDELRRIMEESFKLLKKSIEGTCSFLTQLCK